MEFCVGLEIRGKVCVDFECYKGGQCIFLLNLCDNSSNYFISSLAIFYARVQIATRNTK